MRIGLVVCLPLLGWATFACLKAERANAPKNLSSSLRAVHDEEKVSDVLPVRVPTGAEARGEPEQVRELGKAQPWKGAPVLPFRLVSDREAAREHSLEARAARRSFEGAPPVMPHSASFGQGSKTCLECHTSGMKLGERVGHPRSHGPLPNCLQCHVESINRELPTADRVVNTFAGRRPERHPERHQERAPEIAAGLPPQIPHTLHMRNRCLSCHGEFGYPGLRTSHPERALCVQCHVPGEELR